MQRGLEKFMANWRQFNRWETKYRRRTLPKLTVKQSVRQFCDLMEMADQLARSGKNYKYLRDPKTNPHVRDLINFKRLLRKAEGKC